MENTVFERNYEIVEKMTAQRLYLSEPLPPWLYGRVYKENGRNPEGGCAEG